VLEHEPLDLYNNSADINQMPVTQIFTDTVIAPMSRNPKFLLVPFPSRITVSSKNREQFFIGK